MQNENRLSREEIDALLHATADGTTSASLVEDARQPVLSAAESDALGEIGNMCFGSAATILSSLLQQRVDITTPSVRLFPASGVPQEFAKPYVLVSVEYLTGLSGVNALVIEIDDARTIADLMLGGTGVDVQGDMNDLQLSAVSEAMNQMMGNAATAMSSIFARAVNISPPRVDVVDFGSADTLLPGMDGWIVGVLFRLTVGELIDSTIMQLIPVAFAKDMVRLLHVVSGIVADSQASVAILTTESPSSREDTAAPTIAAGGAIAAQTASAVQGQRASNPATDAGERQGEMQVFGMRTVKRPEFVDFDGDQLPQARKSNLSLLYDVPLNVTVELGRTHRSIKEILDLSAGSILELDKLAGEPVDIYVNHKRIAIGEVVVIDENFGVRVTDIISPVERVQNLQ